MSRSAIGPTSSADWPTRADIYSFLSCYFPDVFRGAIDQARQRWREIQSWMMGALHGPVYEWKVRQWSVTDSALRRAVQQADELRASLAAAASWSRHTPRRLVRVGWRRAERTGLRSRRRPGGVVLQYNQVQAITGLTSCAQVSPPLSTVGETLATVLFW